MQNVFIVFRIILFVCSTIAKKIAICSNFLACGFLCYPNIFANNGMFLGNGSRQFK